MIIWLNGPPGAGKSSTARRFKELLGRRAVRLDLERLGRFINLVFRSDDYQYTRAWRIGVVVLCGVLDRVWRVVLVDMTLLDPLVARVVIA